MNDASSEPSGQEDVLARLVTWAKSIDDVRALVLTSSRARDDGSADALSDYDIVVIVADAERFVAEERWQSAYRRPLTRWGDESELRGCTTYFRGVIHEDGVRVDYTIWPARMATAIGRDSSLPDELDVGYRVLLDEDGLTSTWSRPTFRAHIPPVPTRAEYEALVEEFWWDATYVAKSLWRGDLLLAKFSLDHDAKLVALRRMLEWRVEIDYGWTLVPGVYGRGLQRLVGPDVWETLAGTYVGFHLDDNWEALFRTIVIFRRVAREVADALGYSYPQRVDDGVTAQLEAVRVLPR